ncbi:MAG: hypothetical protein JWR65_4331 [Massilia sp.]|nr:hypothetical protein [Massilia sp.]
MPFGSIALNNTWFAGVPDGSVVPGGVGETGHDWLVDVPAARIGGGADHYFVGFVWKSSAGNFSLITDNSVDQFNSGLTIYSDLAGSGYDKVTSANVSLTPFIAPTTNPIPEPGGVLLLGVGLAALLGARRRKAA